MFEDDIVEQLVIVMVELLAGRGELSIKSPFRTHVFDRPQSPVGDFMLGEKNMAGCILENHLDVASTGMRVLDIDLSVDPLVQGVPLCKRQHVDPLIRMSVRIDVGIHVEAVFSGQGESEHGILIGRITLATLSVSLELENVKESVQGDQFRVQLEPP